MNAAEAAAVGIIGAAGALLYFVFFSFVWGAGYEPTPRRIAQQMVDWAEIGPDDVVVDLGAGTGRLVFAALARHPRRVVAVEIEPLRWAWLRARRRRSPDRERLVVLRSDLRQVDLTEATVVTTFLWPGLMATLAPKFQRELRRGARVVSHGHPIPDWTPTAIDLRSQLFRYDVR